MVGSQNALYVGVLAVVIALIVGIPLGGLAAAKGGWIEDLLMRISDVIYAFPAVLTAILFVAAFQPGRTPAMVAGGTARAFLWSRWS